MAHKPSKVNEVCSCSPRRLPPLKQPIRALSMPLAVLEDSQAARRGAEADADRSPLIGRDAWLGSPSSWETGASSS
jgi:hypothetical protein